MCHPGLVAAEFSSQRLEQLTDVLGDLERVVEGVNGRLRIVLGLSKEKVVGITTDNGSVDVAAANKLLDQDKTDVFELEHIRCDAQHTLYS